MINTNSVSKRFGQTSALKEVSIHVNEGEVYGVLGLNGAGKTTLIRILLGMIKPTSGNASLFGKKVHTDFDQWNDVGYLIEKPAAYPNLSVLENLKVCYHLRNLNDPGMIHEIIEKLKLDEYMHTKSFHLSMGNQQRLGLAKALMHKPKLLLLDEPINGLDPEGIVEVRELMKELVRNGTTVFLSSHILGEISKTANRIGIIHGGRLVSEITSGELTDKLEKKLLIKTSDNRMALVYLTEANYSCVLNQADEIEISDNRAVSHPEHISKLLVEKDLPPKQVFLFTEDLEMYFLRTIRS